MSPPLSGARPSLVYSEDQRLLVDAARELLTQEAPVSAARAVRDRGECVDARLSELLVDQGWAGLLVPESHGGLGLGLPEAVGLMEAVGRQLAATPMVSALMVGPLAPQLGTAEGRRIALAWQEDPRRPDPARVTSRLTGHRLTGQKVLVQDGATAHGFVVSVRDGESIRLVHVDAADAQVRPLRRLDHRDIAWVSFENAPCSAIDGGLPELRAAVDRGTLALAAELLGLGNALFDATLDYLRTREQFGRPLGAFQALQHRAVDLFVALELSRSAVVGAAFEPCSLGATLAKAQTGPAARAVAKESIQMHGGIGMTDEHDAGLFVKRIWCAADLHGDAAWHRQHWAQLRGY